MCYKISNTASLELIETSLGAIFRYPQLYRPEILIDGSHEPSLPVITSEEKGAINFAIWGLMPSGYEGQWRSFQGLSNTLNVHIKQIDRTGWLKDAYKNRRCLIVVTGFFTCFLRKGAIYPYHVELANGSPFCLAGVYNRLNDGFLSCAILTDDIYPPLRKFENISDNTPIVVHPEKHADWLDHSLSKRELSTIIQESSDLLWHVNPISKELFFENITYDSMLNPVQYPGNPEADDFY